MFRMLGAGAGIFCPEPESLEHFTWSWDSSPEPSRPKFVLIQAAIPSNYPNQ